MARMRAAMIYTLLLLQLSIAAAGWVRCDNIGAHRKFAAQAGIVTVLLCRLFISK